jgi:hypothetical protein
MIWRFFRTTITIHRNIAAHPEGTGGNQDFRGFGAKAGFADATYADAARAAATVIAAFAQGTVRDAFLGAAEANVVVVGHLRVVATIRRADGTAAKATATTNPN